MASRYVLTKYALVTTHMNNYTYQITVLLKLGRFFSNLGQDRVNFTLDSPKHIFGEGAIYTTCRQLFATLAQAARKAISSSQLGQYVAEELLALVFLNGNAL